MEGLMNQPLPVVSAAAQDVTKACRMAWWVARFSGASGCRNLQNVNLGETIGQHNGLSMDGGNFETLHHKALPSQIPNVRLSFGAFFYICA